MSRDDGVAVGVQAAGAPGVTAAEVPVQYRVGVKSLTLCDTDFQWSVVRVDAMAGC